MERVTIKNLSRLVVLIGIAAGGCGGDQGQGGTSGQDGGSSSVPCTAGRDCGACGSSCKQGDECWQGRCITVIAPVAIPGPVAADSSYIYWYDGHSYDADTAVIRRSHLDGRDIQQIQDHISIYLMKADPAEPGHLYVLEGRFNESSMTALKLSPEGMREWYIEVDDDSACYPQVEAVFDSESFYWITEGCRENRPYGKIGKANRATGAVTQLVNLIDQATGLALYDNKLFWGSRWSGTIFVSGLAGEAKRRLLVDLGSIGPLAVTASGVFWYVPDTINRADLNGMNPAPFLPRMLVTEWLVDGNTLYYWGYNADPGGRILVASLSTGMVDSVAQSDIPDASHILAASAGRLYTYLKDAKRGWLLVGLVL